MAEKARDIILWNGKVIKWVKRNGVRWVGCTEGMQNGECVKRDHSCRLICPGPITDKEFL